VSVTDEALSDETSGAPVQVVDANPPQKHLPKKKDT
jgi:hypothetical protein